MWLTVFISGLAALLLPIAGIAVTSWMITSSSSTPGGGDKGHLYPASFYDEIRCGPVAADRRGADRAPR